MDEAMKAGSALSTAISADKENVLLSFAWISNCLPCVGEHHFFVLEIVSCAGIGAT
jgi:hypothetical protein